MTQPSEVIVYSKPNCPQCDATKRYLSKHEIEHSVIDVTENTEARVFVSTELGYSGVPVVVATFEGVPADDEVEVWHEHWSGFRPGRIKALVE